MLRISQRSYPLPIPFYLNNCLPHIPTHPLSALCPSETLWSLPALYNYDITLLLIYGCHVELASLIHLGAARVLRYPNELQNTSLAVCPSCFSEANGHKKKEKENPPLSMHSLLLWCFKCPAPLICSQQGVVGETNIALCYGWLAF